MDEVHEKFAPPKETVKAVREWLNSFGIHNSRVIHSDNKGWLAFDATVEEAERLLQAEFFEHAHKHSPSVRVGCDKYETPPLYVVQLLTYLRYHVPTHLKEHIDYITPGIKLVPVVKRSVKVKRSAHTFSKPPRYMSTPPGDVDMQWQTPEAANLPPDIRGCGLNITPPCIKALYQIPEASTIGATPGNSLGLFEQGSYFNEEDIDLFYARYANYIPTGTYPIPALIDGANYSVSINSSFNSGEADIDIDMA